MPQSHSRNQNGLRPEGCNPLISLEILAEWTGLEPATPGVTGRSENPATMRVSATFHIPKIGQNRPPFPLSAKRSFQRFSPYPEGSTMTDRQAFERWFEDGFMDGMDTVGEWDAERNCYTVFQVHMAWKGWQAAIDHERSECAKVCEEMAGTMSMFANSKDAKMHNNAVVGCAAAIRARSQT